MMRRTEQGQANLTAIAILVGLIISAVWIWKRLSPETQEFVIDQAIPIAAAVIGIVVLVLAVVKKIRRRAHRKRERDHCRDASGSDGFWRWLADECRRLGCVCGEVHGEWSACVVAELRWQRER